MGVNINSLIRSDFWFTDGNIVIIAGQAAFKVHRGQLQRHSDVFSDMFSIPQPTDEEKIDGCFWVELYDRPSDVFYFLRALYDGLYVPSLRDIWWLTVLHSIRYFPYPCATDFPAIAGVLRLSTKYLVQHLRELCIQRLQLDWPSTLAGWDLREHAATNAEGYYLGREFYAHPVLVIELALDLNLPSLLPASFYDLCRYGPSRILLGAPQPTLDFDQYLSANPAASSLSLPPPAVSLSRTHLFRVLRGREHVQHFLATFIASELQGRRASRECMYRIGPDPSRSCHESFYFIMLNVLRSVGGIACGRDADSLHTLVQAMEMLSRTDFSDGVRTCALRLCEACKLDFAVTTIRAREEVWMSLPLWFGLQDARDIDGTVEKRAF
jgi:hypothetical protein